MVRFEPNEIVRTDKPRVTVDPGLPPGTYRFRLAGISANQEVQKLAEVRVRIVRPRTLQNDA